MCNFNKLGDCLFNPYFLYLTFKLLISITICVFKHLVRDVFFKDVLHAFVSFKETLRGHLLKNESFEDAEKDLPRVFGGVSLSRSGSVAGSTEDLRQSPFLRSESSDRLSRRRSSGGSSTSSFRCSSLSRCSTTSSSFNGIPGDDVHTFRPSRKRSRIESIPIPNNELILPDLLPSPPPPLPPKQRPPLPPRRYSSEPPPLPPKFIPASAWDTYSDEDEEADSDEHTDTSLPEFPVDGDDSLESSDGGRGSVRGNIPESFPFRDPLQKFLSDLGQALSTEVVIKNVYGKIPGHLDLRAQTGATPCVFSLPQTSAPARPPSLSPAASPSPP
ncbi:hypothetical protein SK128_023630 [Halocaridina rubra]|uniref:Uncharacterized protein n=1 Tax=Halocaridina rubra TaxID=373956 RepID=A0AAN9A432_HALRR